MKLVEVVEKFAWERRGRKPFEIEPRRANPDRLPGAANLPFKVEPKSRNL